MKSEIKREELSSRNDIWEWTQRSPNFIFWECVGRNVETNSIKARNKKIYSMEKGETRKNALFVKQNFKNV